MECDDKLAGISSFNTDNCNPNWPDVYTSVAHFRSWINAKITSDRD